jgi:hypothetical protein
VASHKKCEQKIWSQTLPCLREYCHTFLLWHVEHKRTLTMFRRAPPWLRLQLHRMSPTKTALAPRRSPAKQPLTLCAGVFVCQGMTSFSNKFHQAYRDAGWSSSRSSHWLSNVRKVNIFLSSPKKKGLRQSDPLSPIFLI